MALVSPEASALASRSFIIADTISHAVELVAFSSALTASRPSTAPETPLWHTLPRCLAGFFAFFDLFGKLVEMLQVVLSGAGSFRASGCAELNSTDRKTQTKDYESQKEYVYVTSINTRKRPI
jgi:hypothetical protein